MGGPTPYIPVGIEEDKPETGGPDGPQMKRARVLCAYDAKDGTELNLQSNEVCSRKTLQCFFKNNFHSNPLGDICN